MKILLAQYVKPMEPETRINLIITDDAAAFESEMKHNGWYFIILQEITISEARHKYARYDTRYFPMNDEK